MGYLLLFKGENRVGYFLLVEEINNNNNNQRFIDQKQVVRNTMFLSGGIHVDQDCRKKAGVLPWAGRGPGAARQSI